LSWLYGHSLFLNHDNKDNTQNCALTKADLNTIWSKNENCNY
jgi:hypothetical protein